MTALTDVRPEPADPAWRPPPGSRRPALWLLRQAAHRTDMPPLGELDAAERTRAARFVHAPDSALYAVAHVALRRVLAAYLRISPADVRFARDSCPSCGGPHGRPVLDGASPRTLHFSLSHSPGLVLIAVAEAPVGVDVERVRSSEAAAILVPSLHPAERAELARLPDEQLPMAVCCLWTRKEAYLKGIGTGLCRELDADCLGERAGVEGPAGWTVRNVHCGPGQRSHAAAVALPAAAPEPVLGLLPDLYAYAAPAVHELGGLSAPTAPAGRTGR
ncbi:4'-phosphopantetheinyl transferase family protein [Streptomyces sp. NPDC002870]|uniref:4'-phosphopantetheinyl transferase family protein n=1 Tax=Streptomyces sp. NPDC002870 TaxID=3364666 RepID=UPI00369C4769